MDGTQIYNRALTQTHTNSADYSTTEADIDIDLRYQEIIDEIVSVTKGDYFWDIGKTNTVIGQSEYLAEKLGIAPDDLDIKKINKVFIKYSSTDENYKRATYQNPGVLEEHPDYYKEKASKTEPFFYIQDNSFFVYPAPTEAVTGGIEIFVIHKPAAITTSTTESNIEIPTQFHKLISDGLRIDIFLSQGKENEAQLAQQRYDNGITSMIEVMKQRYNQPIKKQNIVPNNMR